MSATIIDGAAVARRIRAEAAAGVATLDRPPGLATILVGDDPASAVYVRNKRRLCVEAGMRDLHRHLDGDVTEVDLAAVLDELAQDEAVTGILLQLPLPPHLDAASLIARIPPEKDVDGLTEASAGRLALGRPGLRPCTPAGVLALLDAYQVKLAGAEAVVVGRSDLVGRPMAALLLRRDATVTVCHSRTRDLEAVCRRADVLVVAAGRPGLVGAGAVKPGASVIDVGIHRGPDGLRGDVDFEAVRAVAGAVTPVPGGVGPMTIAMLLANTVTAARRLGQPGH
ncbi:bifunctional methylenetetrahydrofolate dehydrogenase/methenyltetrahydrofolate cyclohydrolase FolD [Phytohabitans flavus]|uniref:Bifunctional protein FolD n=1 Tax=Phytohabitans flavus TaxID=1076124 RepID=A0A6F8XPF2_9ACTN|nr:bifunctional methylenetetrahydrofolate dehydrogenase/methenyltetrahydrofolate cyclohydrolase FolD [Phytohabitans flavus]BCB75705.1 bifunctional protein FolD [Phytohabitans flavus]